MVLYVCCTLHVHGLKYTSDEKHLVLRKFSKRYSVMNSKLRKARQEYEYDQRPRGHSHKYSDSLEILASLNGVSP